MLAGYLPFDDDPANPEGDNINLLYKYIVNTPLTFPEYVTPHARDLLRRILVPDPRDRADLFEVARHSWLSEYSHVVGFITSNTTTPADVQHATISTENERVDGAPLLARSASVREPTKTQKPVPVVGELARKTGNVEDADELPKGAKDAKRRTLQVEYVAPRQQTTRGEDSKTSRRSRQEPYDPIDLDAADPSKPLPTAPGASRDGRKPAGARQPSRGKDNADMPPPQTRPGREPPRAVSDNAFMAPLLGQSTARPNTGGSMVSNASGRHYSQTAAPAVATTTAHGRMSQPQPNGKRHDYGTPGQSADELNNSEYGRPSVSHRIPPKFARISGMDGSQQSSAGMGQPMTQVPTQQGQGEPQQGRQERPKTHKRSSTISSMTEKIFGRQGSIFGGTRSSQPAQREGKKYPPVSYQGGVANPQLHSRPSVDSRRSISQTFGFGKKRSGSVTGDSNNGGSASGSMRPEKVGRRFSLLPTGFSLKSIGIGKSDYDTATATPSEDGYYINQDGSRRSPPIAEKSRRPGTTGQLSGYQPQPDRYGQRGYDGQADSEGFGQGQGQGYGRPTTAQTPPVQNPAQDSYSSLQQSQTRNQAQQVPGSRGGSRGMGQSVSVQQMSQVGGHEGYFDARATAAGRGRSSTLQNMNQVQNPGRGVLQKNNRRFVDAYEGDESGQYGSYDAGRQPQSGGSSGAARKVMDFFRRRGRDRGEE